MYILEAPVIDKTYILQPSKGNTVFSAKFYSVSGPMSSNWYKDKEPIRNVTNFIVVAEKYNFNLVIYEKEISHPGHISNLTVKDNTPGQYILVLQNTYGEIRVSFYIPDGKFVSWKSNYEVHFILMHNVKKS